MALNIRIKDPEDPPTVWDFVFKPDRAYQVIATLSDGSKIAGGFGDKSRVSTYPEEQELYLESAFEVREDGSIGPPLALTRGVLLRRSDIRSLEFFEAPLPGGADEQEAPK